MKLTETERGLGIAAILPKVFISDIMGDLTQYQNEIEKLKGWGADSITISFSKPLYNVEIDDGFVSIDLYSPKTCNSATAEPVDSWFSLLHELDSETFQTWLQEYTDTYIKSHKEQP